MNKYMENEATSGGGLGILIQSNNIFVFKNTFMENLVKSSGGGMLIQNA